jgi:hypothetical protein
MIRREGSTLFEDQLDSEAATGKRAWRYALFLAVVLSVAALPNSRYQNALKMAVWTVIFFGLIITYAWPFIVDALSGAVIAAIALLHFPIMLAVYPRLPPHGYLMIGLAIAAEYAICIFPIAWLDVRSQEKRQQNKKQDKRSSL